MLSKRQKKNEQICNRDFNMNKHKPSLSQSNPNRYLQSLMSISPLLFFFFNISTGPPAPSSVNVSMVMITGGSGLSVSWELGQAVHGSIYYHAMSDQGLTCNSSSSPCVLSGVSCGEMHTIQVVASNEAGPSQPSSPVPFITCTEKPVQIPLDTS